MAPSHGGKGEDRTETTQTLFIMKILEFFDIIYIINLPKRTDRRREMTRELVMQGLPPTPGRIEFFPAIRPDDAAGFPNIGARGCFLSHLSVLRLARQDGLANVLIMEDDLALSQRFGVEQEAVVDELDRGDWDFVYLGHPLEVGDTSPVTLVPFTGSILLAHFYGVNGRVLDRLISFLEVLQSRPSGHPDGGPMHTDGAYSTFRAQNPNVVTLVSSPSLGWQRSSRSDIADDRWFDRVPGLRTLATSVRTAKSRLIRRD